MELLRAVVRSPRPASAESGGPPAVLVATRDAALLDLADRMLELRDGELVEH